MSLPPFPDRPEIEPVLTSAKELAGWINGRLHDLEISGADRCKIPGLLFDIAIEHHVGILELIHARIYAGAYALVRSEFEAYVRGLWLHFCASDAEIDAFVKRDDTPRFRSLIDAIEALESFKDKILSGIMANAWNGMNGYTHGGAHQIVRRMKSGLIEPNYEPAEILEVLRFSGTIALMSLAEIARMADKADLIDEIQSRLDGAPT